MKRPQPSRPRGLEIQRTSAENEARTVCKFKTARHFAPVPLGDGVARVALVLQQTSGVVESRQRRRMAGALCR